MRVKKGLPEGYRPDIDGMRALAILLVIAFHAFPSVCSGGFVGVDVFFVLSGFLISTLIYRGLDRGRFSFADFYARRIRRIFPALLLLLAFSLVLGWFALLADEYRQLGKHVAASAGFVQNVALWKEAGYFDVASELKPLMHLWSLAVEEQFYLVFPFVVWLVWRFRINVLFLIAAAALFSFAYSICETYLDPTRTFFSSPARCWELMSGAVLAWFFYFKPRLAASWRKGHFGSVMSWLGVSFVLASAFFLSRKAAYPGWPALFPVAGTVLLVAAGEDGWINQAVLSNRWVVWIGLISYPLYLWHWALLSFARITESGEPSLAWRVGLVGLSFVLAALTHVWVEKPIRYGTRLRKPKMIALASMMALVGVGGYACFSEEGFKSRLDPLRVDRHIAEVSGRLFFAQRDCLRLFPHWLDTQHAICALPIYTAPTIEVIGDSHAERLYPGLAERFKGKDGVALFPAECAPPFLDISSGRPESWYHDDYKLIGSAIDYAIQNKQVKIVVLVHHAGCSVGLAVDRENLSLTDPDEVLKRGMRRTFEKLLRAGKKVILVFDNPQLNFDPLECQDRPVRLSFVSKRRRECVIPRRLFDDDATQSTYRRLAREVLVDFPQVRTFDVADLLCDKDQCQAVLGGKVLYEDQDHLNVYGSEYVAGPLSRLIQKMLKNSAPLR